MRAVVSKVDMKNNTPIIVLSRTSPMFLERLFEQEVPEVFDGLITIKNIVREPGYEGIQNTWHSEGVEK
jgi:transcription termination/antitermination protein NusA